MKHAKTFFPLVMLATMVSACDDDPTGPASTPCTDDTGTVSVTVGSGLHPVIDWDPECAVALVLVEEDAGDQWLITTDEDDWSDAGTANLIVPPVTYGVAPAAAMEPYPALPLRTGVTYEVILWRVLPAGSSAQCQQTFGNNVCLMALQEFSR